MRVSFRCRGLLALSVHALLPLALRSPTLAPPAGSAAAGSALGGEVPGNVAEMRVAGKDLPALDNSSRSGYLSIECGYQAILYAPPAEVTATKRGGQAAQGRRAAGQRGEP